MENLVLAFIYLLGPIPYEMAKLSKAKLKEVLMDCYHDKVSISYIIFTLL